ncbi:MAG TPA: tetratricopeptide repeat protein [Nitrospiria bacterium]|nr:tetratricopeptide repeat protein [Nitrospiria bacterium]
MRTFAYYGMAVFLMAAFLFVPFRGIQAAEKKAEPALEVPASSPAAGHNSEGIKHYNMGVWKDAEMHFGEAVKADEKSAEAHYNHALALDKLGMHKEATAEFDEALKLAPDNKAIADSPILKAHLQKMKKMEKPMEKSNGGY